MDVGRLNHSPLLRAHVIALFCRVALFNLPEMQKSQKIS